MSEGGVSRPIAPMDTERLEKEMESYQNNLDAECEAIYQLAGEARAKGFDLQNEVEIPRVIDLADRAEKLLCDELVVGGKPLPIAENIRKALAEKDREDAAIDMAVHIALQMDDAGEPVHKCIDTGL
ncbi:uncharacterized protein METZ01_LOCUS327825, partial [marine metagenome]